MMDKDLNKNSLFHNITPKLDFDNQILSLHHEIEGMVKQHIKDVCDFKEEAVRTALIKLGWKPPEGNCPKCGGSGNTNNRFMNYQGDYDEEPCLYCKGTGVIPVDKEIKEFLKWLISDANVYRHSKAVEKAKDLLEKLK